MIIKVNSIMCSDCFQCHEILPFLCDAECGLEGMPMVAKVDGGFLVNGFWAKKYYARFHAAKKSCKFRALIIEE